MISQVRPGKGTSRTTIWSSRTSITSSEVGDPLRWQAETRTGARTRTIWWTLTSMAQAGMPISRWGKATVWIQGQEGRTLAQTSFLIRSSSRARSTSWPPLRASGGREIRTRMALITQASSLMTPIMSLLSLSSSIRNNSNQLSHRGSCSFNSSKWVRTRVCRGATVSRRGVVWCNSSSMKDSIIMRLWWGKVVQVGLTSPRSRKKNSQGLGSWATECPIKWWTNRNIKWPNRTFSNSRDSTVTHPLASLKTALHWSPWPRTNSYRGVSPITWKHSHPPKINITISRTQLLSPLRIDSTQSASHSSSNSSSSSSSSSHMDRFRVSTMRQGSYSSNLTLQGGRIYPLWGCPSWRVLSKAGSHPPITWTME